MGVKFWLEKSCPCTKKNKYEVCLQPNINLQEIYVGQIYVSVRNIYIKDVLNIRLGKQTKTQKRGFNQPGEKFNRQQT